MPVRFKISRDTVKPGDRVKILDPESKCILGVKPGSVATIEEVKGKNPCSEGLDGIRARFDVGSGSFYVGGCTAETPETRIDASLLSVGDRVKIIDGGPDYIGDYNGETVTVSDIRISSYPPKGNGGKVVFYRNREGGENYLLDSVIEIVGKADDREREEKETPRHEIYALLSDLSVGELDAIAEEVRRRTGDKEKKASLLRNGTRLGELLSESSSRIVTADLFDDLVKYEEAKEIPFAFWQDVRTLLYLHKTRGGEGVYFLNYLSVPVETGEVEGE